MTLRALITSLALAALATGCARVHSDLALALQGASPGVSPHERTFARTDTVVERSIRINARPECVYEIVADVTRWAEWDPSIERAHFVEGDTFDVDTLFYQGFTNDGFKAHARVLEARRGEEIVWRGQAPDGTGPIGLHSYRFIENPDGSTTVINREAFSGWYLRPAAWFTDFGIGDQFGAVLAALSTRAAGLCATS